VLAGIGLLASLRFAATLNVRRRSNSPGFLRLVRVARKSSTRSKDALRPPGRINECSVRPQRRVAVPTVGRAALHDESEGFHPEEFRSPRNLPTLHCW
jgi:hypothetical protein